MRPLRSQWPHQSFSFKAQYVLSAVYNRYKPSSPRADVSVCSSSDSTTVHLHHSSLQQASSSCVSAARSRRRVSHSKAIPAAVIVPRQEDRMRRRCARPWCLCLRGLLFMCSDVGRDGAVAKSVWQKPRRRSPASRAGSEWRHELWLE